MDSQENIKKEVPDQVAAPRPSTSFETTQQVTNPPRLPPIVAPCPSSLKRKQPEPDSPPTQDTITLIAGPHHYRYTVPTQLLLKVPFFRGVINNTMFRKETDAICLPNHWPGPVFALLHWLQYEEIDPDVFAGEEHDGADVAAVRTAAPIKLFPIYQLAKMVMVEEFQNKLMDLIVQRFRIYKPRGWLMGYMLGGIGTDDKLHDLLMQLVAVEVQGPKGWAAMKASQGDWYVDFAKGMAEHLELVLDAMAKYPEGKKDGKGIWEMSLCEWHAHEVSKKCGKEDEKEVDSASVVKDEES